MRKAKCEMAKKCEICEMRMRNANANDSPGLFPHRTSVDVSNLSTAVDESTAGSRFDVGTRSGVVPCSRFFEIKPFWISGRFASGEVDRLQGNSTVVFPHTIKTWDGSRRSGKRLGGRIRVYVGAFLDFHRGEKFWSKSTPPRAGQPFRCGTSMSG